MKVYFNEIDEFCCAWLSNLMDEDLITPGKIDQRSIEDVTPQELKGYDRCHFFAGIGVWDYALNQAGWQGRVWTGSCPCQPFSAAGKGGGFADERHLWPAFFHLIGGSTDRPPVVLGEQVASKDGLRWLDLVQTDLESQDYTVRAVDTCAAGFGAPHIRQRLYWVANTSKQDNCGRRVQRPGESDSTGARTACERSAGLCTTDVVGNPVSPRLARPSHLAENDGQECTAAERTGGAVDGLADVLDVGCGQVSSDNPRCAERSGAERRTTGPGLCCSPDGALPTNGLWRDADWLYCRDNKWRPVRPGTFPLANAGTYRNRVAALRGAGNAINLAQAQGFIEAVMAVLG